MANIVKGTTPTITYTFCVVKVSELREAILTLKSHTSTLTKTLSDATVKDNALSWKLSQEETLSLKTNDSVGMMLNFVTQDGTRGASDPVKITIKGNYVEEVI